MKERLGRAYLCLTEAVAARLGFGVTELRHQVVTLADGRQRLVPRIAPIEIAFANRSYVAKVVVLGDKPMIGVIPLGAMDLVIDPRRRILAVNPAHPTDPVAPAA